jgi:hypothetical protein
LDDLINDIDGAGGSGGTKSGSTQQRQKMPNFTYEIPNKQNVQTVNQGGKCYPLYMGGSSLPDG